MRTGDLVYIKANADKVEHEIIDVTYDREDNEMYTLMDVDDEDFYPSELELVK